MPRYCFEGDKSGNNIKTFLDAVAALAFEYMNTSPRWSLITSQVAFRSPYKRDLERVHREAWRTRLGLHNV